MKKIAEKQRKWIYTVYFVFIILFSLFIITKPALAQSPTPIPCGGSGCPEVPNGLDYQCAQNYDDWQKNPYKNFWVEDEKITILGKSGERARQFVYWVINRSPIYYHKSLLETWANTRNLVFAFLLLVALIAGASIIINNRFNFSTRIDVEKTFLKLLGVFLFVVFSSFIVILAIQLTDLLMKFFVENLEVNNLFNIFFTNRSEGQSILSYSEGSYKTFVGCKNLSTNVVESLKTSIFLVQITNLTYFIIGLMFLIRQIVLWFLIILSPFLAILLFFRISKNVGIIWIGVFLQWAFYGPLTALFLGTVAKMWQMGIPFNFNFSRANDPSGFIYPTAINILYGGPSQQLTFLNSSNYVDTFAEYIVSLLMLWTAILLPWWLLRTFRDYCCDGIYAIKNMLLAFYESSKGKLPPSPTLPGLTQFLKTQISTPQTQKVKVEVDLRQIQNLKQLTTQELVSSLNLRVSSLQDIAKIETNVEKRKEVERIITSLKQPDRVAEPKEREKIMLIKNELHSRALKQDRIAQRILQSTSISSIERERLKREIVERIPTTQPATQVISKTTQIPAPTLNNVFNTFISTLSKRENFVNRISERISLPQQKVIQIVNNLTTNLSQPITHVLTQTQKITQVEKEKIRQTLETISNTLAFSKTITNVSKDRKIPRETVVETVKTAKQKAESQPESLITETQVTNVITSLNQNLLKDKNLIKTLSIHTNIPETQIITLLSSNTTIQGLQQTIQDKQKTQQLSQIYDTILSSSEIINEVSNTTGLPAEKIEEILTQALPQTAKTEENIEKAIEIPPTVPIEEYENTKKLWKQHYLKGEVPVSENITSREEWLEQDIIFLTNILNKLLSEDEKLKEEALEDLSYILPVFVINDLSPEQLIIYLKARLEAAKDVREQLQREEEIKEKLKKEMEEETFVEIPLKKEKKKEELLEEKLEAELPEEQKENEN